MGWVIKNHWEFLVLSDLSDLKPFSVFFLVRPYIVEFCEYFL